MTLTFPKFFLGKKSLRKNRIRDIAVALVAFLRIAAEHVFWASILAIVIAVVIGVSVVLAKYRSGEAGEVFPQNGSIHFSEELYRQTVEGIEKRKKEFKEADERKYPNIFIPGESTGATVSASKEELTR